MEFDTLLVSVGDNGLYQMAVFSLAGILALVSVDSFAINFLAGKMNHKCAIGSYESSQTWNSSRAFQPEDSCSYATNEFINWTDLESSTEVYSTLSLSNSSSSLLSSTSVRCTAWLYDRSVFTSTIQSQWDLVCDRRWLIDLVSTVFMGGRLVACLIVGPISDRFGRRTTIFVFHALKMVGSVISVYALSYELYIASRFIIALGSTASALTSFLLLSELIGEKYRHFYGISWNALIAIGGIVLPGIAYFVRDYQSLQAVYTWPQFAILFAFFIIDESPRWMFSQGHIKAAINILQKIASVNGRSPLTFSDLKLPEDNKISKRGSILDLLSSPNLRRKSFVIWFNWFTDALMYYALSLNTGRLPGDIFLNTLLLMIVEVPANAFTIYLLGRIGRKKTLALFTTLAGIAGFLMIPFMFIQNMEVIVTVFALLGKACITVSYSSVYVVTAEIYPTCVRGVGLSISASFARLSGMGASFVGGLLSDVWRPLPSIIFGVFGVLSGFLVCLLPETRNQKLPETIQEAEESGRTNATKIGGTYDVISSVTLLRQPINRDSIIVESTELLKADTRTV